MRHLIGAITAAIMACGPVGAQDMSAGKAEYMIACAICHGGTAKGAGPFSEYLNIEVPSLTGLAAANDGAFPYLEVYLIIDGRGGVRGHGQTMPVWGDRFSADAQEDFGIYGAEIITQGRIAVLVNYLASLQE